MQQLQQNKKAEKYLVFLYSNLQTAQLASCSFEHLNPDGKFNTLQLKSVFFPHPQLLEEMLNLIKPLSDVANRSIYSKHMLSTCKRTAKLPTNVLNWSSWSIKKSFVFRHLTQIGFIRYVWSLWDWSYQQTHKRTKEGQGERKPAS